MPGHHRAKTLGFDDDEVYGDDEEYDEEGEEGGNGMTEEDREQLRVGTIKVKEALDSSVNVSDAQIQEALWHYYYDIGKSVTYLKNKHAPQPKAPAPPKQKAVSRFDQAASAAKTQPKTTPGHKPKAEQKIPRDRLAESVEKVKIEEVPKVRSKNLNVVEEFRKSGMKRMANFVVIGHVDHGKSTLMGRLLYDLKVIDQRSVDKLRREAQNIGKSSFALAWVMDETSEERNRGVTIDIATNFFETEKTRFTILDAPGHRDFIPNMIAGASQADFAILVIDASTNSFESGLKGQTKEHALLVRSMGVLRLVIAINKMDTVSWSQTRFNEISNLMMAFLTAANFLKKNLTFIPCAGLTGENVTRKVEDPRASWYTGGTLIEAGEALKDSIDSVEPKERSLEKPLRMTVDNVFRGGVTNPTSISGRIDAGTLQVGDTILAMPANETAVVKAIEVADEPVDWAVAGQITTLHLTDVDPVHLRLGDVVCDPNTPVKLTKRFKCKILAFEHVFPMSVDVFRGRLQTEGKVRDLKALLNKNTGAVTKRNPRIVKPGEVARVVVLLERELPLEVGTRIVLREGGNTIAAGMLEE
ncbi:elongation factor EF-1 alpha subunit [Lindgomyces ingoldianus]|uniref:Elongation factor EF-1 alpha subunit n=1 Tax=Lindgomyces ingoldianus TaxID=673940 RepID=A0ACB6R1Z6_9PLEO|nr:elongation factor EF-1 alpha subunit [Lindgomyces ingoldianus]KAF2472355.1 elongation factor EF-1 alpha subunit [Lindgomyces ingoldianus]